MSASAAEQNTSNTTTSIFGTDGIRGIANQEPMTVESVVRLVRAAASVLIPKNAPSRPSVVIGRDTRASGEMLEAACVAALNSIGIDVWKSGVLPTPGVACLTIAQQADFGIVISASHNPFSDNGIKFFRADGYKLSDTEETAIETAYANDRQPSSFPIGKDLGRTRKLTGSIERYVELALATWPKGFSLKGTRVVLDTANGAAYQSSPFALDRLGADLIVHHSSPDGYNINENCGSNHPNTLSQLVRDTSADVGLAHDGDADRLLLCDESGSPLDGDDILAIAAIALLRKNALLNRTLVATIMSNFGLEEALKPFNAKVLRTPVGDRFVIDALVQNHLNFGGEQSGHIVFRDFTTTGDGLIGALQILAILKQTGQPLSVLRKALIKFPQILRNIPVQKKIPFEQFPEIGRQLEAINRTLAGQGRVVLRYSGTEPKARLLLEGLDAQQLTNYADQLEELLIKVR
jgi:phosphoglucosamine mutase